MSKRPMCPGRVWPRYWRSIGCVRRAASWPLKNAGTPSTALDDLLEIEEGKINDTRLYRGLDRILPHKTKLEQHLKQRYGELFVAEFDVLLYDLTSTYVEGASEKNPMMVRGYSRDHRPDCEQMVIALIVNSEGFPFSYETFNGNRRRRFHDGNDSAHGGAQIRQGAAGFGIWTRRCRGGGVGGGPPKRGSGTGGDAPQPDAAGGGGGTERRTAEGERGGG